MFGSPGVMQTKLAARQTGEFVLSVLPLQIAQPQTYPQLPLSFANRQLFGGAL